MTWFFWFLAEVIGTFLLRALWRNSFPCSRRPFIFAISEIKRRQGNWPDSSTNLCTVFHLTLSHTKTAEKKTGLFLPFYIRKEVHRIKLFEQKGKTPQRIIGITGMDSGVGVTHLALSLATYCTSKRRRKTAVLEFHPRDELSLLSCRSPESASFHIHGFDCFPQVGAIDMPFLLNQGYDYLILDMGSIREADFSELLRCNVRLVLCSSAPWKSRSLWEFHSYFDDTINLGEGFFYLLQTGNPRKALTISEQLVIPARKCRCIPFIQNPFCIEKELFLFFEELLTDM
jgi:hypothetical protein